MKTIYQKPETKTVEIGTQNLMVISGDGNTVNSVGVSESDYSGGDVLSRRGGSLWDDED